jgi:hypothetical protein
MEYTPTGRSIEKQVRDSLINQQEMQRIGREGELRKQRYFEAYGLKSNLGLERDVNDINGF